MTRNGTVAKLDTAASQDDGLRQAVRRLAERYNRELRYAPRLTGKIVVTVHFREGIPKTIEDQANHHEALPPLSST